MKGKRRFKYEGRNKPWTRCGCSSCKRQYHTLNIKYKQNRELWEVLNMAWGKKVSGD